MTTPPQKPASYPPAQTIAMVGNYPPRRCGIATFTLDLRQAIAQSIGRDNVPVVAMDDIDHSYTDSAEVRWSLRQHSRADYRLAADTLNRSQMDCAIIQHEYGIFGGDDGRYILDLVGNLRMPVITTLHTLLIEPSPGQRRIIEALAEHSSQLVVMTEHGKRILEDVYDVSPRFISLIPHGIHEQPFTDPHFYAERLGLAGKRVLLTFGLMGPGKGLETVIRALPAIVAAEPNTVYLILGATHPHELRRNGTRYRESLEQLASSLGVRDHVHFEERFVNTEELGAYLGVADVYVVPYTNEHQVTSGTLAYAVGAGKAVVSTPFWHATELLADERGCLFPFGDVGALSEIVIRLLENDDYRNSMRRRAYQHSRNMLWTNVGQSYVDLANRVLSDRRNGMGRPTAVPIVTTPLSLEHEPSLDHIVRLSDDTGMLQHARYSTPDRAHGYCIDDNARAFMAVIDYLVIDNDPRCAPLADVYLAFMNDAWNASQRRFRNFMSYGRTWLEDIGSEDSQGRTIWALGSGAAKAPLLGQRMLCLDMFNDALPMVSELKSPRAWAFAILGLTQYVGRVTIDCRARSVLSELAGRLHRWMQHNPLNMINSRWVWPESELTYDNARVSQALIEAGTLLGDDLMQQDGIDTIDWLIQLQHTDGYGVSLIGNHGWANVKGHRARFDQQPLEICAIVDACEAAHVTSGDPKWVAHARQFYLWFLGVNDLSLPLRDPESGGCSDGLHPTGSSFNQGAESTLALFTSTLALRRLHDDTSLRRKSSSFDLDESLSN